MHMTHGKSGTPTHRSWAHMLERCRNAGCRQFKWYGAKGVTVCERWLQFENFVADMGLRPDGTTLDRVDRLGNYEPRNCRWVNSSEQQRNRGNVILDVASVLAIRSEHIPRRVTYSMLATKYGVSEDTIAQVVRGETWA